MPGNIANIFKKTVASLGMKTVANCPVAKGGEGAGICPPPPLLFKEKVVWYGKGMGRTFPQSAGNSLGVVLSQSEVGVFKISPRQTSQNLGGFRLESRPTLDC